MKRGVLLVLAPVVVVVLVVVALVFRPTARALKSGEAEVQVHGVALVSHADGTEQQVTSSVRIHTGDTLEVRRGSADVKTNDAAYTARAGSDGTANTRITMAREPSLLAGELLASSSEGATVRSSDTSVTIGANGDDGDGHHGESVARLTRTLALRLSVYRGSATIESAGNDLMVHALRAAEVATIGQVPGSASPLRYHAADAWDRTYLSTAITIDQELDPLARAFDQSSPATVTPASLHVSDLPGADEVASLLVRARKVVGALTSPSDAIVGASVVSLGQRGPFATRWDDVFAFHAAGASWGLVAMDQGVAADPLVRRVRQAIDRTPISIGTPTQAAGQPSQPTIAGSDPTPPGPNPPATTDAPSDTSANDGTGRSVADPPSSAPTTTTIPPLLRLPPITLPPVTLPPVGSPEGPNALQGLIDTATNLLSGLLNTVSGPEGLLRP